MLTFLGLIVLVVGFIACHISPNHVYKLHRYEGQYLYLKSAELGLKCLVIAVSLTFILYHIPSFQIGRLTVRLPVYLWLQDMVMNLGAKDKPEAMRVSWFLILSATTFLSAYIYQFYSSLKLRFRFGTWNARVFIMGGILADSPLDNLLFNLSLQRNKYVMISMDDRKVYVGKVISLGEPSETNGMDQDITIIPLMSGYRDKDDLAVKFTTHYGEVDQTILLSLRQSSIISATEFNFDAYSKWNVPKPAIAPETKAPAPAASGDNDAEKNPSAKKTRTPKATRTA
ncbi:hypothetical protein [Asticcacaulis benevestitus]|uniref:Uncharacterized protein n=1 Tax=Asticcacaulis benevestitus DSM 16100 = ATCC BAA-896 TaxID=1121022 RepID=V4PZG4_9CAUL|nr:hypothetical protein [Asticcacaulis benevestitus]ESQ90960.1 hypothetical protein ABENE_10945 [Asticcacaulis benevestitus DSM 16100 = ATCC BAA-896]